MFKAIAIILTLCIASILIYAATRADAFRIERSISINASPKKIFPHINNLHQWEAWSPWEKLDPELKRTYNLTPKGQGAVYEWSGNKHVGQGRMEIIESSPPTHITLKLDFKTPFESHNFVEFNLLSQGESTTVTQSMYGPIPYLSKLLGLFFSMEKMVGEKYEEGLANLKRVVET